MTSKSKQKNAVLARLKQGPATKWQLIMLGQCHPGARIWDLRKDGYEITTTEKRVSGKRICTYSLAGYGSTPAPQNERVTGHRERVGECANCGEPVCRKPKARSPLPGERLFCQQSCHDAYWNGRKRQTDLFTAEVTA